MQFAVYISDTTVILKQSQGHQTYNDNVDPKQGYNYSRFEKSLMVSEKKPMSPRFNVKGFFFFKLGNVNYLSWTYVKINNSGIFMIY